MGTSLSLEEIKADLVGDQSSIMVFGSHARNEAGPDSDIDILQLLEHGCKSYRVGRTSVAVYDVKTLTTMARRGSLFVLHLRCDGQILQDGKGRFEVVFGAYKAPESYDALKRDLRLALPLLDVTGAIYIQRRRSLKALALYLLRTHLYIEFAETGRPMFSVWAIANMKRDPRLPRFFRFKYSDTESFEEFLDLVQYLEALMGTRCKNIYGSSEALVTNVESESMLAAKLGLRLLKGEGGVFFGYEFPWES
jgi:hypothetical protein